MAQKSSFQLVNRGRKDKPCWTVEHNGKHCYSNRRRGIAEGYLKMCRELERKEIAAKKAEPPAVAYHEMTFHESLGFPDRGTPEAQTKYLQQLAIDRNK
jgi:hypothetical protein